jgi:hypothetical protein
LIRRGGRPTLFPQQPQKSYSLHALIE